MRWIIVLLLVAAVAWLVMDDPEHTLKTLLREAETFIDRW